MDWLVHPSKLRGTITLPASKSQSIRALFFAYLAKGPSKIVGLLDSPDVAAAKEMGKQRIDVGNSGLVLRFATACSALQGEWVEITGDESIRERRVIIPLLDALTSLGADVRFLGKKGRPPFSIRGPIRPGKVFVEGRDSQPISALLLALSSLEGVSEIVVENPGETPWIDVTLEWLERMGVLVEQRDYRHYRVVGRGAWPGFAYCVPGDASSAAFPVAAALVTNSALEVCNVPFEDTQGDLLLFDWLESAGKGRFQRKGEALQIVPGEPLRGKSVDMDLCIDGIAALSSVALYAKKPWRLCNVEGSRTKESDRVVALCQEMQKLGGRLSYERGDLVVTPSKLRGGTVSSCSDHRIAMALAVAALGAEGPTRIQDTACVEKTFPRFFSCMEEIGAEVCPISS